MKPDRRHAAKATIGAAGGTVSTEVHGITYALDVPAGALAADTEITVTPADAHQETCRSPARSPRR
jgi:hypothetical protein